MSVMREAAAAIGKMPHAEAISSYDGTTMWRVVVLAMLELSAACARFPAAPAEGGPVWTELTSAHFTVWTDADPSRVCELIRKMERFRHVAAAVAYPTTPSSGRALAVVVRNDQELSEINNGGEARAFSIDAMPPLWQPIVLLSLSGSEQRTLVHELTHLISFSVIHHQPRWLAEGMAAYFEGAQLDANQATVTLGAAPLRYGNSARMAPVAKLFDWNRTLPSRVEIPLYQTAWALFAFLINEHKAELAHYLWLIDRTGDPSGGSWRDQQQRAWDNGFPSLPVEQLDARLDDWLEHGSHHELSFYVRPTDMPVTARRLSDADAYAVRSLLLDGPTPEEQARGRAERSQALAREPTNVLAWCLRLVYGEQPTIDVGRAIAAAHPGDWRAWWLATIALEEGGGDPAELDHARGQACALLARNRALVAPPRLCPRRLRAPPQ